MSEDAKFCTFIGCLITFYALLIAFGVVPTAYEHGYERMKLEATEAGVAEFVADPKTGNTTFQWKPCDQEK